MKVRTRFALSFAYVLIAVILALTIPFAIDLRQRAVTEATSSALESAQNIATSVAAEHLPTAPADVSLALQQLVRSYADRLGGRVIVVNATGVVLIDQGGQYVGDSSTAVGQNYFTSQRPEIVSALGSQTPFAGLRFSQTLGRQIVAAAAPIIDEGTLRGAVRISTDIRRVTDNVRRVTIGIVVIGLSGLLSGLIIALVLAGSLAKPLATLASAARRLGRGDLSSRVGPVGGGNEIRALGASFDEMADRLQHVVESQREFVANASHQLRTPLTGIKLRIASARGEASTENLRAQLDAADREVDRLAEIVDRLLTMARQIEEGEPTHADVGEAAVRAAERWRERAERSGSVLRTEGASGLAEANPGDLDQILDNLLDNAVTYAPGSIGIETGASDLSTFVAVVDEGTGIPIHERARVTERFYRGSGSPPGGSGLGLAIARQLAEKWGGTLVIADAKGGGTRVEVRLRPSDNVSSPATPRTSG